MRSSYALNNYADIFYYNVTVWRPQFCVELGVLDGYSTLAIARGLKENVKIGVSGHLDAYDLFDDYEFNHGSMPAVQAELDKAGVSGFVTLHKADAFEAHKNHEDQTITFLHVDLSNTGETLRRIIQLWDAKICQGGIFMFEGGTEERDQVEWMIKYNKVPIKPEVENNPILNDKYVYGTYLKYPGVTCFLKKRL